MQHLNETFVNYESSQLELKMAQYNELLQRKLLTDEEKARLHLELASLHQRAGKIYEQNAKKRLLARPTSTPISGMLSPSIMSRDQTPNLVKFEFISEQKMVDILKEHSTSGFTLFVVPVHHKFVKTIDDCFIFDDNSNKLYYRNLNGNMGEFAITSASILKLKSSIEEAIKKQDTHVPKTCILQKSYTMLAFADILDCGLEHNSSMTGQPFRFTEILKKENSLFSPVSIVDEDLFFGDLEL